MTEVQEQPITDPQMEQTEVEDNSAEAEELKKLEDELRGQVPAEETANNGAEEKPTNADMKAKIERLKELRKRRKEKKRAKKLQDKPQDIHLNSVLKELETSFDGREFEVLIRVLQPSVNELKRIYYDVRTDLYSALTRYYPDVDIKIFGSCLTDLIFYKSDLDFFVDVPGPEDNDSKLNRVYRLICNSRCFDRTIKIGKARTPLIKAHHHRQKVPVDINISNPLGVFNSEFLRWALCFDPRIKPLAICIKYWARVHHLAGTNLISNYCLTMLLLFYLMNLRDPVFPAIRYLQERVPEYYIGPWNMVFDQSFVNTSKNMMPIVDLLEGFFEFFAKFPFEEHVLSLYSSKYYPRKAFEENRGNIPEAERYFQVQRRLNVQPLTFANPVCVQDPFELNVNIGNSINGHTLKRFRDYSQLAMEIFKEFPASTHRASIILKKLFTTEPQQKAPVSLMDLMNTHVAGKQVCKLQPMTQEQLLFGKLMQKQGTTITSAGLKRLWTSKCVEFIEKMFKEIFQIRLFPFEVQRWVRSQIILCDYQLRIRANTWDGRDKIEFSDKEGLEKEKALSEELKEKNGPFTLDAELTIKTSRDHDAIEIELNEISDKESNKELLKKVFEGTILKNARSCIKSYCKIIMLEESLEVAEEEHNGNEADSEEKPSKQIEEKAEETADVVEPSEENAETSA